jgi:hypothetical protein
MSKTQITTLLQQTMTVTEITAIQHSTTYTTPGQTHTPHATQAHTIPASPTPAQRPYTSQYDEAVQQESANLTKTPLTSDDTKLGPWKWATIGAGSAAVIFGAGMIGVLVRQHIRDKNLIQFEMIDDPALGHTLLD